MAINFKDWQKTLHEEVEQVEEALKGDQVKLDVDKDGKIEGSDLKKLRGKKETIVFNKGEEVKENENCGKKMYREFVEEIAEIVEATRGDEYGWEVKAPKEKPASTTRKVAGKAYGGAAQKDDEDDEEKPETQVKRGRGRPAGSKSGARTAGNGKNYGGLAFHSLNLPSKK